MNHAHKKVEPCHDAKKNHAFTFLRIFQNLFIIISIYLLLQFVYHNFYLPFSLIKLFILLKVTSFQR